MAWSEQWSIKVVEAGNVELNDGVTMWTECPQATQDPEVEPILGEIEGDYPVLVRTQPREGQYTFLVAFGPCSPTAYWTRLSALKGYFPTGTLRTVSFQVRGMPSALSVKVARLSVYEDFGSRLATVQCIAPRPVLA